MGRVVFNVLLVGAHRVALPGLGCIGYIFSWPARLAVTKVIPTGCVKDLGC